jgi:hypothetical protein
MMLSTWCPPKWFASHPWPCFVPSCNNGRLWMTARRGGERRVVCRRNRLNIIKPFCPRFLVSKKNSNGRWCYIDHPCFPCGSPQPVEEKWHRGCENPHRMVSRQCSRERERKMVAICFGANFRRLLLLININETLK